MATQCKDVSPSVDDCVDRSPVGIAARVGAARRSVGLRLRESEVLRATHLYAALSARRDRPTLSGDAPQPQKDNNMHALLKSALALTAAVLAGHASAQVTFYEHDNFDGRAFTTQRPVDNFTRFGFNDRASSVAVSGGAWEVCDDAGFHGRCVVLRPGNYPSLGAMNLNDRVSSARPARPPGRDVPPRDDDRYAPQPLPGQITFFEQDGFHGRAFGADGTIPDFRRYGFNDRASSVMVLGDLWEACDNINFTGRCVILRPGRYPDLGAMGLNNRVSSVRKVRPEQRVDDRRHAPRPVPVYDWRRRPEERVFEVPVTSVRAVYATPQQRCWMEREQVVQQGGPNVGGAVIGGILGGILGHQVGNGSGRDIATVGGAVAGAAIGGSIGRDGQVTSTQNVQRCAPAAAQGRPEYWDVTYDFRGAEHHVQMTAPPGRTVLINDNGEPRL
jgi:uncharacterized protein YcfJ